MRLLSLLSRAAARRSQLQPAFAPAILLARGATVAQHLDDWPGLGRTLQCIGCERQAEVVTHVSGIDRNAWGRNTADDPMGFHQWELQMKYSKCAQDTSDAAIKCHYCQADLAPNGIGQRILDLRNYVALPTTVIALSYANSLIQLWERWSRWHATISNCYFRRQLDNYATEPAR
jgi:hypothetical protein